MSIALIIKNSDHANAPDYTPISTEVTFKRQWMPYIEQAQFQWLALFQSGFSFERIDIPEILAELSKLLAAMEAAPNPNSGQSIERLEL